MCGSIRRKDPGRRRAMLYTLEDADLVAVCLSLVVGSGVDVAAAAVYCPDGADLAEGLFDQALLERDQCARRDRGLPLLVVKQPGYGGHSSQIVGLT